MFGTDTLIWVILGGTTAVCVVSMLGVFASIMRSQTQLHDLRNRVTALQYKYTLQLARLHGHIDAPEPDEGGVDVLDAGGNVIGSTGAEEPARAAA